MADDLEPSNPVFQAFVASAVDNRRITGEPVYHWRARIRDNLFDLPPSSCRAFAEIENVSRFDGRDATTRRGTDRHAGPPLEIRNERIAR